MEIIKVVYGLLLGIMLLLSALLCVEYMSLHSQVQRLAQIQEEYQTYTLTFRKVLRDYQRLKEGEEDGSSDEDDEKKKEQPFLIVNREPAYLQESAARFLRKHRMTASLENGDEFDEIVTTRKRRKRPIMRRRTRAARGSSLVNSQLNRHRSLLKGKALVSDITFAWPIDRSSFWISSFYGSRRKPDRSWGFHHGIDLAAIKGTPVKTVANGVIVEAGNNKGYGNTIVVMHDKKYKTRYAHLHKIYARLGQHVETGQLIGAVGDTGLVRKRGKYASHLHLEVYVYGKRVNPLYFFV